MSRYIDVDKYRKDLLSAYDDVSMEFDVLDRQPLVQAIPLEKVKQVMADLAKKVIKYSGSGNEVPQAYCDGLKYNLAILNELIEEVEDEKG